MLLVTGGRETDLSYLATTEVPHACTVLYCTVLHCTVLCCAVLYCTVLGAGAGPRPRLEAGAGAAAQTLVRRRGPHPALQRTTAPR